MPSGCIDTPSFQGVEPLPALSSRWKNSTTLEALEGSDTLTAPNLSSYMDEKTVKDKGGINLEIPKDGIDLEQVVGDLEKTLLLKALEKTKGVKKKAADLLHINFRSMRYRLGKYGID